MSASHLISPPFCFFLLSLSRTLLVAAAICFDEHPAVVLFLSLPCLWRASCDMPSRRRPAGTLPCGTRSSGCSAAHSRSCRYNHRRRTPCQCPWCSSRPSAHVVRVVNVHARLSELLSQAKIITIHWKLILLPPLSELQILLSLSLLCIFSHCCTGQFQSPRAPRLGTLGGAHLLSITPHQHGRP